MVRLARSGGACAYPCRFSLVAAMNPCPCGYFNDPKRPCSCALHRIVSYKQKLSGPLLDRFDMQISLDRLSKDELMSHSTGDSSDVIRQRVEEARRRQTKRYGKPGETNSSARFDLDLPDVSSGAKSYLGDAIENSCLTGRGLVRLLRVSRTVADMEGQEVINEEHVGTALGFRLLDPRAEVGV